jgi:Ca-activated chloride channel family protein
MSWERRHPACINVCGHAGMRARCPRSQAERFQAERFQALRSQALCQVVFAVVVLAVLALATLPVIAQSGRNKEKTPNPAPAKSRAAGPFPTSGKAPAKPTAGPSATAAESRPKESAKDNGEDVDPDDTVRVVSNLVPIPASVVDPKGFAIVGLKLEDFELRVDGQVRQISDLTRTETSVRMAMLFDNSGSLHQSREFEKQAAMHFFRAVMRPADEAAIYSIESDSYLAQALTSDIGLLERTIGSFGRAEGSTSLFDAIVDAAAYLRPYTGRRVVVIVSDGADTTSRNDFEATIQRVLADDCQVFIVQTGLYDGANLRALAAERRMEQLAGQTGGAVYIPKSTSELEQAFEQIAADLAQQYVLSYYPGNEHRDGSFHVIDLRIRSRKDVRVRARKGYYSPKDTNVAATE